jgi:hypothetical protein
VVHSAILVVGCPRLSRSDTFAEGEQDAHEHAIAACLTRLRRMSLVVGAIHDDDQITVVSDTKITFIDRSARIHRG